MSEISEQLDDNNRVCPYCLSSYHVEAESCSEDTREEECLECGKKFYAWESFSVTHYSRPDCALNGIEHVWAVCDKDHAFKFCDVCGSIGRT